MHCGKPESKFHIDLGKPSERKDATFLRKYYDDKLQMLESGEHIQVLNQVCLNELCRQVSVMCFERGQLLTQIISHFVNLSGVMRKEADQKQSEVNARYAKMLQTLEQQFQTKLDLVTRAYEQLEYQLQSLTN